MQWLIDDVDLNDSWCLVHATHMDASEIAGSAASGAVASICPLTEATMGDGFFPLVKYHGQGGHWGIGTDSHYSTSVSEELRWLECGKRLELLRRNVIADLNAGAEVRTGRTLFGTALDAWILGGTENPVRDVMVGGNWVVRAGRHAQEGAIRDAYKSAMERRAN